MSIEYGANGLGGYSDRQGCPELSFIATSATALFCGLPLSNDFLRAQITTAFELRLGAACATGEDPVVYTETTYLLDSM